MKRVILTLEYDLGDYSDVEDDGGIITTDPEDYEESFYQSDAVLEDMEIVGVRVEE